jgi:hypothetical protein
MTLKRRQAAGRRIASLVMRAERDFGPGTGPAKLAWVLEQSRQTPDGEAVNPCRWLGRRLLRVAVEAVVALINMLGEHADDLLDELLKDL